MVTGRPLHARGPRRAGDPAQMGGLRDAPRAGQARWTPQASPAKERPGCPLPLLLPALWDPVPLGPTHVAPCRPWHLSRHGLGLGLGDPAPAPAVLGKERRARGLPALELVEVREQGLAQLWAPGQGPGLALPLCEQARRVSTGFASGGATQERLEALRDRGWGLGFSHLGGGQKQARTRGSADCPGCFPEHFCLPRYLARPALLAPLDQAGQWPLRCWVRATAGIWGRGPVRPALGSRRLGERHRLRPPPPHTHQDTHQAPGTHRSPLLSFTLPQCQDPDTPPPTHRDPSSDVSHLQGHLGGTGQLLLLPAPPQGCSKSSPCPGCPAGSGCREESPAPGRKRSLDLTASLGLNQARPQLRAGPRLLKRAGASSELSTPAQDSLPRRVGSQGQGPFPPPLQIHCLPGTLPFSQVLVGRA